MTLIRWLVPLQGLQKSDDPTNKWKLDSKCTAGTCRSCWAGRPSCRGRWGWRPRRSCTWTPCRRRGRRWGPTTRRCWGQVVRGKKVFWTKGDRGLLGDSGWQWQTMHICIYDRLWQTLTDSVRHIPETPEIEKLRNLHMWQFWAGICHTQGHEIIMTHCVHSFNGKLPNLVC